MRIVHVCLRYPPASGGTETYVREIVEHTRNSKEQRDVRVLTSQLRTHGPISTLDPNLLLNDPLYIQRLHHLATPWITYPRLQALPYYLSHHHPDIVEAYSFWYQPADKAAQWAKKHRRPFIFHPLYYENDTRRKPHWQLYRHTIGQRTFAQADVVIVISPFEQSLIEQAGLPVQRFALIPPGIDPAKYTQPQPNPFTARNIAGDILLTVGRVAKGKGLIDVVNALPGIIQQHPTAQWVVIGEDFGARKFLKRRVRELGLSNHVHWLGKLSDEEKISAMQHAALLLHPSHYEAFGIVLAEALASRLPIVGRRVAAIPYVAPHNQAGLLFNNNDELVTHVSTLLDRPTLRQQFGQQGRQHVVANFTWDSSIAQLLKLYDELKP